MTCNHTFNHSLAALLLAATGFAAPQLAVRITDMRASWDKAVAIPDNDAQAPGVTEVLRQAEINARLANQGFFRSRKYIDGWLARADPETGLIPRNLKDSTDFWNGRDAAADNYPYMVLTASMTDRRSF